MHVAELLAPAREALGKGDPEIAEAILLDLLSRSGDEVSRLAGMMPGLLRRGHAGTVNAWLATFDTRNTGDAVAEMLHLYFNILEKRLHRPGGNESDASDIRRRIPLFQARSNHFLSVNVSVPITTCNYRCEYCFLHHQIRPDLEKLAHVGNIIERLARIPRPLGITLTPAGEIMAVPPMWPLLGHAARLRNAVWVEVMTNLSRDPELLFEHVDPAKLCLIASYHPTEFHDFDREDAAFFARLARAKEKVRDISVSFVIYEKNMPFLDRLTAGLEALGIHLTAVPQNNRHNGYGMSIPSVRDAEADIARGLSGNEFLDYFQLQNRRADVRCTSGRDAINIGWDGEVSRCEHIGADARRGERLGNILDDEGPLIDTVNRHCAIGGCTSTATLGYIEPCVARYRRRGTRDKFERRPDGETGAHSYDPVDLKLPAEATAD